MDPFRDLPMGFGMALLQNPSSSQYFESLNRDRQRALVEQTHQIRSKSEMKAFVDDLPNRNFY